jgi:hypothetical protein
VRDLANKGKIFGLEKKKKAASDDDSCFILFYLGFRNIAYVKLWQDTS